MRSDERTESPLGPDVMATLDASRGPRPEIEEAVVDSLRRDRWLGGASVARGVRSPWAVGLLAAGLTFAIGFGVGERHALPDSPSSAVVSGADAESRVRRAAAEYIEALAAVPSDTGGARNAALSTFRTAADQILRLAPESNAAIAMQFAFPASFAQAPGAASMVPVTHIIRF